MKRRVNLKLIILSSILALMLFVVSANVFVVSVLGYHINSGTDINKEIDGVHKVNNTIFAKRGEILDKNGKVLAYDASTFTLYANIDENTESQENEIAYVADKEDTATKLAPILGIDKDKVMEYLNSNAKQVEFGPKGKYLTLEQKEAIEALDLPGLGFMNSTNRFYPYDTLLADLIGFTRFDENLQQLQGLDELGLEYYYNKELTGTNGKEEYLQTADGTKLTSTDESLNIPAKNGNNLQLTIDLLVQQELENSLKLIVEDPEVKSTQAWGAVMNVKTGEIVAMGQYPSYSLNEKDITDYANKIYNIQYEPGSTMKTFTVAAAIDQGVYPGEETFDSGTFYFNVKEGKIVRQNVPTSTRINNIYFRDYGYISFNHGYYVSSNVMIAELLTKHLDIEVFHDYLLKLGFFSESNLDRFESPSGNDNWNYPFDKLTVGFGQGATVTTLQMLQAYTSVLTDGTMVKPYVIKSITDSQTNEVLYEGTTEVVGKPFKESTAQQMKDLMRGVVVNGSGSIYDVEDIEVIGKTGTAQIVIDGAYAPDTFIHSRALAYPYEDPQYMTYILYQAPGSYPINKVAEYINNITSKVASVYGLAKKTNSTVESKPINKLENYINKSVDESRMNAEKLGLDVYVIGDGKTVINQYPLGNTDILPNEKIFLYTGSTNLKLLDMKLMTLKEVQSYANLTGLNIEIEGSGYVVSQSIEPDTKVNEESVIKVKLE